MAERARAVAHDVKAVHSESPFPGLRPFDVSDSALFYGRDGETYELLQRLRSYRFLAVSGPSACGKSSLVRAGLISVLLDGYLAPDGGWSVPILRPGQAPMRRLAEALAGVVPGLPDVAAVESMLRGGSRSVCAMWRDVRPFPGSRMLIVVDQFEELFHGAGQGRKAHEEVKEFIGLLLETASGTDSPYVLITLRSEWLGQCAAYQGLAQAINDGLYLVPLMSREQLRQAIVEPAAEAGATVPSQLVDRLLNDAADQEDQLPLLQHVLMRMWQAKGSRDTLELQHYLEAGPLSESLDKHAEQIYKALGERRQRAAELLFRAITEITPENRKVRRPCALGTVSRNMSIPLSDLQGVARIYLQPDCSFITATDASLSERTVVDISHEALIRRWRRLSGWAEAENRTTRRLRLLQESTARWLDHPDKSYLYQGLQLWEVEDLVRSNPARFTPGQREFVLASRRWERWKSLRLTLLIVGALAVTVVALSGGLWVYWRQNRELEQAKKALDEALSQTNRDRRQTSEAREASQIVARIAGAPRKAVTAPVRIQYFAKPGEIEANPSLIPRWEALGFAVEQKAANLQLPSNCIWYGSKVSPAQVRLVALALIENGIALRRIVPIANDQGRENVIQVGWAGAATNMPLMGVTDVTRFPRQNPSKR